MNYQKIYDQIIDRARGRDLQGYKEKHHVMPKCIGGSNEAGNIVQLTAREHFLCHWMLCRVYPSNRKLAKAFNMMCQGRNTRQHRHIPSGRTIQEAKELDRQARKGVRKTQESIEKRTATRREKGNYRRTEESIQKGIQTRRERDSYKGKEFTAEHRNKLGKSKRKQVVQYTLEEDYIYTYESIKQAATHTNTKSSGISRAATGKTRSYKGFIWKYV